MTHVVLDSNVMFDPFRRYLILSLARRDLFQVRWSTALQAEWGRVIVREGRALEAQASAQLAKLARDWPEAVIAGTLPLTEAAMLVNDPDDAIPAATALAVAPSVLLTYNTKDFKRDLLASRLVQVRKPGPWLGEQYEAACRVGAGQDWLAALADHRATLRHPPYTATEYREKIKRSDLAALAEVLPAHDSPKA